MLNNSITQIAAWVALVVFAGMFCFQVALVFGVPWGRMAWGGKYKTIPNKLRIASLFSAGIFVFGALCIMEKTKIFISMNRPDLVEVFLFILVAIFGLSTFGNILSSSELEKRIMTPIAVILFLTCLIVAVG